MVVSKYRANKTVIDGITFDSKAEGQYYLYLKEKEAQKLIEGFELQPRFTLQASFEKDGKSIELLSM